MDKGATVAEIQSSATVDWTPLGDIYVKKYLNYNLDWQVNLAENHVSISPYGGPIAIFPRVVSKKQGVSKPVITIYTQAGKVISTIPWGGGNIIGLGWTSSEHVVCILEDGNMVVYNIYGKHLYARILAREIRDDRVLECKFFHTLEGSAGFAVMTNKYQFFLVADSDRSKDDIRVKKLADIPSSTSKPNCWAVLPVGNQVSVTVAIHDRLFVLDPYEAVLQTINCKKGGSLCWVELAVSPNGKAVALVDQDGYLWGGSSDFKVCETEFDLQSRSRVLQLQWGGKDFFVLVMDQLMFVKGFDKHWCKYHLQEPCFLLSEIDGVRILTNSACEFMHRVTSPSLAVLRIGSMEVGALLNDAYKEYEGDESHKADEYIRFVKDRLPEAVMQCIKAAGEEFQPPIQQSLLKSSNFGKGFLGPDIPSDVVNEFVEMCHQLRVLNSVRQSSIGIPITFRQYYRLSTGVLIDRLINRGLYPLAMEICKYLKIPPANGEVKILKEWALRKIQDVSLSDDEVARQIIDKFNGSKVVVSFAEIARASKAGGRKPLAAMLLDHEVHARDQVPMLMEMDKVDIALDKAVESGDPQLMFKVLDELKYKRYHSQMDKYLQLFHHRPVAAALYRKLCKEVDQEQLLNLHRQESDFLEAGCLQFAQSFRQKDPEQQRSSLEGAVKEYKDGQHMFHLRVAEEQGKLSKEQAEISRKCGIRVTGESLYVTIYETTQFQCGR
ncbi:vacuolar protein sorting-associated protein 16 homolog isoform X2 [Halichondria panicea]|uniref:vacuolar protein sorting-associated protein 16 homolog isoform X2 n=1 Tax=Halichondria panicea TaxID=6063 RepID=UPI00312B8715